MSEISKKESKPGCPVPEELRKQIKDTAEIIDKHKKIIKKLNPFG